MKLLFCLNRYSPFGGLERDCLRIARACVAAGDIVEIITQAWEGPQPENIKVHCVPIQAFTNHGRSQKFSRAVMAFRQNHHFDGVMGFNKMPGLDIYYAGDNCYRGKFSQFNILTYLNPRIRTYTALENAVFSAQEKTHIFLLNPKQQEIFTKCYQTQASRFHILPPGIELNRRLADTPNEVREKLRQKNGIAADKKIILFVASFFKTKGLDRALKAIASLPLSTQQQIEFWVVGKDDPKHYAKAIVDLNIADLVKFVGASENVPEYLLLADLLLHPAYTELAGMVLLEALAAGVPVITTAVCGYAHYIEEAGAGIVISEPFAQKHLNAALVQALMPGALIPWREKARHFSQTADIYRMPDVAVKLIHQLLSPQT